MLYLDYAASTPIGEIALKNLIHSFRDDFANPSSTHKLGKKLYKKIDLVRENFLQLLDAPKNLNHQKFIFTSSATESNNLVINGLKLKDKSHILYTSSDHPSMVNPALNRGMLEIDSEDYVLSNTGEIIQDNLLESIDSARTQLILFSTVNNQSGNLHPIEKLSKKIKEMYPHIHIHIDASQSFGKLSFSIKKSRVDSVSISSHKIYGPKGVAALYIKDIQKISAITQGGAQEFGLRSSTVNAPLIFAFSDAVFKDSYLYLDKIDEIKKVNDIIRKGLSEIDRNIIFPFPVEVTSPYILTFIVPMISSDILLRHLEEKEIYLSSTSACSSRIKGEQVVFKALNIDKKYHKNVLRLSLSYKNNKEDAEIFLKEYKNIYEDIKVFFR